MSKGWEIRKTRESKLDATWATSAVERLKSLPFDERETIACAIDENRRDRLRSEGAELPLAIRSKYRYYSEIQLIAAELLLKKPAAERLAILEMLSPENGWAIDAGLRSLRFKPLGPAQASVPVRASADEFLFKEQADWLFPALCAVGPQRAPLAEIVGFLDEWRDRPGVWSWVFAGAIDAGGDRSEELLKALMESVRGERGGEGMTSAQIYGLLCCSREEAWECMVQILRGAKRQEGVRQSILRGLHASHPRAFARIAGVVVEEGLCRFSSVVAAANGWFGFQRDSSEQRDVERQLEMVVRFVNESKARVAAVKHGETEEVFFALWAAGFESVDAMLELGRQAIADKREHTRVAGVCSLGRTGLGCAAGIMRPLLDDPDLRVALAAAAYFGAAIRKADEKRKGDEFDAMERLLLRLETRKQRIQPDPRDPFIVLPDVAALAALMLEHCSTTELRRMLPHVERMSEGTRVALAGRLEFCRKFGPEDGERDGQLSNGQEMPIGVRNALLKMFLDPSDAVARAAKGALNRQPLKDDEVELLKMFMRRDPSKWWKSVFTRLMDKPVDWLVEYAREFIESKKRSSWVIGLSLCEMMVKRKKGLTEAVALVRQFAATRKKLGKQQQVLVAAMIGLEGEKPTREGAFGLVNPANLSKPVPPRELPVLKMSDAAWEVLGDFVRIVIANKTRVMRQREGQEAVLLGNFYTEQSDWPRAGESIGEGWAKCPIADLLREWFATRRPETRDADGLELLRAAIVPRGYSRVGTRRDYGTCWPQSFVDRANAEGIDLGVVPEHVLDFFRSWVVWLEGDRGYATVLLDSAEGALQAGANVRSVETSRGTQTIDRIAPQDELYGRPNEWIECLGRIEASGVVAPDLTRAERVWQLAVSSRAILETRLAAISDDNTRFWSRNVLANWLLVNPNLERVLDAIHVGCVNEDDLLDAFTQQHGCGKVQTSWQSASWQLDGLAWAGMTAEDRLRRSLLREKREHPIFVSAVARLRKRIIDLELVRTEVPTQASVMACAMQYSGGAEVCVRCAAALQPEGPVRVTAPRDDSRRNVLTRFVKMSFPSADDTPEKFVGLAKTAGLTERTLVVLGMLAPQWVEHVERALGKSWTGFEDAVWWVQAHLGLAPYGTAQSIIEKRQAVLSQNSMLTNEDIDDGAVDAAWFVRVVEALGRKKWEVVSDAAGFGRKGLASTRVRLLTDAMLGRKGASERELTAMVKSKRHQDAVRALGLVPLKKGAARDAQMLTRYRLMQDIRRTSREHGGSMRQESERRAVEIGMENLARTAGFPDPLRLHWAMERLELGDLAAGSMKAVVGDVEVTLTLDEDGEPVVQATKKGKVLANVPTRAKNDDGVSALLERVAELRKQRPRMRQSLESAMCRGDTFRGSEIAQLWEHPMLRAMLQRLVLVGDGREEFAGYPNRKGIVLRDHAGVMQPVKGSDVLRIAHPLDLLKRKDWHLWQRECYAAERVQPFKQVFREVYVATESELGTAKASSRYAGQQVEPRQALALLGARGWVTPRGEGSQRTYHKERVTAYLSFEEMFYTPVDVEGLTVREVCFAKSGRWATIAIADVPERVFSETMRDLDLLVSVAHRSGVDPEASQSTVEMRASLVRETALMLRLANVTIEKNRVTIKGSLAEYVLHLGSANVQVMPGGSVCIVPVASEHRGRLFLPFADSDPKTAEVMSKLLLLARDEGIRDPSILAQIRAMT